MLRYLRRSLAPAAVAAGCLIAAGCGGAIATGSSTAASAPAASTATTADWARQANRICAGALADASHSMIDHLDIRHVTLHGRAVVAAGSRLDQLGPAPGADSDAYDRMVKLYKQSAAFHVLTLRELARGDDGNAAVLYSQALYLADRADRMAASLGAQSCTRFGMDG